MNNPIKHIIKHLYPCCLTACLIIASLVPFKAHGQTDAQFTQFWQISNFYNPGAIGCTDFIKIRGGWRQQWLGIEGAPSTFIGTADMPVKIGSKRIGVGAVAEGESMGLFNSLSIGAQGAYKFNKFGGTFSVGFNLGMYDQKFRGSDVFIPDDDDFHQSTDDAIPMRDIHGTAFDASVGVFFYNQKFWTGLSCTHLTSPTISMKSEQTESTTADQIYEFQANRTLYFMAGCNIPIKYTLFELMPALLVKSDFTFTSAEGNLRVRYNKFLNFGIGYRWKDAVYATIGAEFKDFFIGYAYDYATSAIAKASSGSHEVFVGYSMKLNMSEKNKNKHKSIRIM